jgi:hypothetical protein
MAGIDEILAQSSGGQHPRFSASIAGGGMQISTDKVGKSISSWAELFQQIVNWLVWSARIVLGIGICYAAWSMFFLENINLFGQNWKVMPKVVSDPSKLIYLAACIWLYARGLDLK